MNRINFAMLCLVVVISGCSQHDDTNKTSSVTASSSNANENSIAQQEKDQNERFESYKSAFIEEYWKLNPARALYNGYYKYDDQLPLPNEEEQARHLQFIDKVLKELQAFSPEKMDANNSSDFYIIKHQMDSSRWYITQFRSGEWNPARYNVAGGFGLILNTKYKSLDERLRVIEKRLTNVPLYYQIAMRNIKNPTVEHTELAIQQSKGAVGVFKQDIPKALSSSQLSSEEKSKLQNKLDRAVESISGYTNWLENKLQKIKDGGAKDFRIGKALYDQKFKYDIFSDYSAKQLYDKAVAAKDSLHARMIKISKELWPKYFPGETFPKDSEYKAQLQSVNKLIQFLSVKHVKREDFVSEIRRQMPIIEAYIKQADLVDLDPSRPLVVRETPEYQRGVAGASVNSPGPYDATANTYYNVTPLDNYTDEQAESYLREYNHWILQVLNIHEALPGHYVQLVHANKSPSMIKSLFGNGAMIEGWAVYSERMMLESGYGNQEPELWLMYSKWNLRVVVNTILDYSVQVLAMSKDEALDLLMNEAFQERTEAEGKWRRATLSQVQLTSYFSGYEEIYDFREQLKKEQGKDFNLKEFHNQFLSYGSAPVPIIKKLMLQKNK